jgi:hypothetical protein
MYSHMTPKKVMITDAYNRGWEMIWIFHFLKTLLEYFDQLGLEGIDECWIIDVTVQAKQCENV